MWHTLCIDIAYKAACVYFLASLSSLCQHVVMPPQVVDALLKRGADQWLKNHDFEVPLYIAALKVYNHLSCVPPSPIAVQMIVFVLYLCP